MRSVVLPAVLLMAIAALIPAVQADGEPAQQPPSTEPGPAGEPGTGEPEQGASPAGDVPESSEDEAEGEAAETARNDLVCRLTGGLLCLGDPIGCQHKFLTEDDPDPAHDEVPVGPKLEGIGYIAILCIGEE